MLPDHERNGAGAVVRALASHQCVPGSRTRRHMWVEFVVGSPLCSEKFFSEMSPQEKPIRTGRHALNYEPLARVIAQALPVFDVKFTHLTHFDI